jgi:ABC-2 type transport system permease protein
VSPPASLLWLLGHELRLTWRGWFGRRANGKLRGLPQLVITVIFLLFVMMVAGVPLGWWLRHREVEVTPLITLIGLASLAGLSTLMLSQTLLAAVNAFYERGDLDLLLSSPVAPIKVLAVRAVSIALSAAAIFAILLAPVLAPIAVLGHPAWLAAYLVLGAIALAATGLGLLLGLALMTTIGPRRTKTAAQLLAAVIGALFFIVSQLQNITGSRHLGGFWSPIFAGVRGGDLELPRFASWPARAALGEPGPLAAMIVGGALVFALSVALTGRRFAADAAAAKGAEAEGRVRTPTRAFRFRAHVFPSLLSKEVTLLWRDPAMLSQVLLRVLYIPPLVFVVLRNVGSGAASPALAGGAAGLVFMAGQISASLSWITVSAEEAPELLAMSPAPPSVIWRAKLAAALLPVGVLIGAPLVILAWFAPFIAALAAAGCAASALSSGLINIWMQKPANRRDFRRRRSASVLATLAELMAAFLWSIAVFLGVTGYGLLACAPIILGLVLLGLCRRSEASILDRLAETAA